MKDGFITAVLIVVLLVSALTLILFGYGVTMLIAALVAR